MADDLDCDVLVVGAGPTGLTLGLLLARRGVRTLVIDKEADIYPLPRAAHIDHEIVRVFQELGVADVVMATSRRSGRYDFLSAKGEILLRFEGGDRIGPGGWPAANMVHQPSIERAFRDVARGENSFDLKNGWRFLSYASNARGVDASIATPDGERTICARYLVGADGARSQVRSAAGIEVDDLAFDEPWLVIDTIVHDESRLPGANLQICDPERPTTCVLMGAGRHRWEFMLKPGETAEQVMGNAFIAALLAPWNVDGAVSIERKAVYRFNAKVAKAWRVGPVLLAGDAAHQMPPFAGQGLCSGIRDAANLAWKIAAIAHGAGERILDSYQTEREPHVRGIIGMAMMMGRTVCITDPAAAAKRDAQMLAARAAGSSLDGAPHSPPLQQGVLLAGSPGAGTYFPQPIGIHEGAARLDDALGAGAWLISRGTPPAYVDQLRTATLEAPELAPFRERLDGWLASHKADAVLVRADRYVFGTGAFETLCRAWRGWMS
jgi:3-(3-hydroxy-phenyl)propionate hydroxylase